MQEKKERNLLVIFLKDFLGWSLRYIANRLNLDRRNLKRNYTRDKKKYTKKEIKETINQMVGKNTIEDIIIKYKSKQV